jgi:hypothetical protein
VAKAAVLMRSKANKSENHLFVRASNADFMSGNSFRAEQLVRPGWRNYDEGRPTPFIESI